MILSMNKILKKKESAWLGSWVKGDPGTGRSVRKRMWERPLGGSFLWGVQIDVSAEGWVVGGGQPQPQEQPEP